MKFLIYQNLDCDLSMGITNPHVIPDKQLTASSSLDMFHGPSRGRLEQHKDGLLAGAWSPRYSLSWEVGSFKKTACHSLKYFFILRCTIFNIKLKVLLNLVKDLYISLSVRLQNAYLYRFY